MKKKMKAKAKKAVRNRSSESGRFVTDRFAKSHKATTVTEKIKKQKPNASDDDGSGWVD